MTNKRITKKMCQMLISKKIKILRKENIPQRIAVGRGINEVLKKEPYCRKFYT